MEMYSIVSIQHLYINACNRNIKVQHDIIKEFCSVCRKWLEYPVRAAHSSLMAVLQSFLRLPQTSNMVSYTAHTRQCCYLLAHAVVSPADVDMLAELLSEVAAHWDLFLGQLGLPQHKRDVIRQDNARMAKFSVRCLLDGLRVWVESEDRSTYCRITAALRGSTVCNEALAQRVEQFAERQDSGKPDTAVVCLSETVFGLCRVRMLC